MPGAFYQLWFAARYVHVASITLLAGGAALACIVCAPADVAIDMQAAVTVAAAYEWLFWSAAGVTALSGVSNLALKGDGLLDATTSWGAALTLKLTTVGLLLFISFIRTDVVVRCREQLVSGSHRARTVLAVLYALTLLLMLTIAWRGLGLAHGRY